MHTALGAFAINDVMLLISMALMRPEQSGKPRQVLTPKSVQSWVVWVKVFSHVLCSSQKASSKGVP